MTRKQLDQLQLPSNEMSELGNPEDEFTNEELQQLGDDTEPDGSNADEFFAKGKGRGQFRFKNDAYFNDRPGMNLKPPGLNDPQAEYWMQKLENR